ncbi:hypothetical protein AVEN_209389-1 [Araneus ventricosus]|uniref:Uncharacterized protein n=1 Tax=Araneus ventricosus TaxID=182803 RepID=A0A4Y2FJP6_ARAVE|nr:hypothetical protein AVEN_209389-1 [Araneus ventricosus]
MRILINKVYRRMWKEQTAQTCRRIGFAVAFKWRDKWCRVSNGVPKNAEEEFLRGGVNYKKKQEEKEFTEKKFRAGPSRGGRLNSWG